MPEDAGRDERALRPALRVSLWLSGVTGAVLLATGLCAAVRRQAVGRWRLAGALPILAGAAVFSGYLLPWDQLALAAAVAVGRRTRRLASPG